MRLPKKPLDLTVCIAQATSLIQLYLEANEENRTYSPLIFGTELIINPTYRQVVVEGEPLALTCKNLSCWYVLPNVCAKYGAEHNCTAMFGRMI